MISSLDCEESNNTRDGKIDPTFPNLDRPVDRNSRRDSGVIHHTGPMKSQWASPTLRSTCGALSSLRSSTIAMDFSSAGPAISTSPTSAGQRSSLGETVDRSDSQELDVKCSLSTNCRSDQTCAIKQVTGQEYYSSATSTPRPSSLKRRAIAALRVHFDQNGAVLESQDSSLSASVPDSATSRKALEQYILRLQQKIQGRAHMLVDQCGRLDLCRSLNEAKVWLKENGKGRKAKEYNKRLEALRRDGCKMERKFDEADKAIREYESILENIRSILQSGQCSSGTLTSDQKGRLDALLVERTAWFRSCMAQFNTSQPPREKEMSLTYFCSQTQMMTEVFYEIVNSTCGTTLQSKLNAPVTGKDTPMPRYRGTDTSSVENELDSYSESAQAEAAIILQTGAEKFKENMCARLNPAFCQKTCTTDNLLDKMEETICCDDAFSEPTTPNMNESYSQSFAPQGSSTSNSITIELPQSDPICDGQFQCTCGGLHEAEPNIPSQGTGSVSKGRHVSFADDIDSESELPAFSHSQDFVATIDQMNDYERSISDATTRLLSIEYEVFSSTRYNTQELNTVLRTIRKRIRQYASSCLTNSQEFYTSLSNTTTGRRMTQKSPKAVELAETFQHTSQNEWNILNAHIAKCLYWLRSKAQSVHSGYAEVYNCAWKDLADYQQELMRSVNKIHRFLKVSTTADLSECTRNIPQVIHQARVPTRSLSSSFNGVDKCYGTTCRRCGILSHCR